MVPCNDLIEHETTDDCVCLPTSEAVIRGDGSIDWVTVHHSIDGRELDG